MRALIVEDDIDIRDFLKRALESECFLVDATADGARGLYLGKVNSYDVIILDHILPKKNGFEICQELRAVGSTTPIIITTVKSALEQKIALLDIGADDYLVKPYSLEELMARIRAILRRPKHIEHSIYTSGDLLLDASKHKVIRGTREIYLTKKEFSLLEYLMRHKGSVVSRGVMMEHVWNREDDPFSNTLEAHILNLRKKIEQKNKPKLIHNIPGRGYRIDDVSPKE